MNIYSPSLLKMLVLFIFLYTGTVICIVIGFEVYSEFVGVVDWAYLSDFSTTPPLILSLGWFLFLLYDRSIVYTTHSAVYQKQGVFRPKLLEIRKEYLKVFSSDRRGVVLIDSNGSEHISITKIFLSKDKYIALLDELEIRT